MIVMKYYLNTYQVESQFIVSVCDEDLLGKCFREEKKVLDLEKYSKFYKGVKADIDEIKKVANQATVLNLVGKHIIEEAIRNKWCDEDNIQYIAGVPQIQVYKMVF